MKKFFQKLYKIACVLFLIVLVYYRGNPSRSKNMRIIKLNKITKNYVNDLLQLQRKAIEQDATEILHKINTILFTINEQWRNTMLSVNEIDYHTKGYKMIVNSTCYKF